LAFSVAVFESTEFNRSLVVHASDYLNCSQEPIATWLWEDSVDYFSSTNLQPSSGAAKSSVFRSSNFHISSAGQPSAPIFHTQIDLQTSTILLTVLFANSRAEGFSHRFTGSYDFTGTAFYGDGAAETGQGWGITNVSIAVVAATAVLAGLALVIILFVRRQHNHATDVELEDETEANAIDLNQRDCVGDRDDDRTADEFNLAIESAFCPHTQVMPETNGPLFLSDCDEIF
jgi:hypothetical protein